MANKWVYLFTEGNANMRELLGGKGANLAEMTNIGLPVPQGFTITTEACTQYYEDGREINAEIQAQINEYIEKMEEITGKKFGDKENPLLVSVRSGARASMPGMMDTILNLGLNEDVVEVIAKKSNNPRWAWDCYRRFIQMYSDVVMEVGKKYFEELIDKMKAERGVTYDVELTADDLKELAGQFKAEYKEKIGQDFPDDPKEQLMGAVKAVFRSWDNPRANVYRRDNDIPYSWGTAVNVQSMAFGNMGDDCGTGVAFTRNPATGEKALFGEYLIKGFDYKNRNIRICFMGDRTALDPKLQKMMNELEGDSACKTGMTLNIAINYGGRPEIVRAAQQLAAKAVAGEIRPEDINEQMMSDAMYTAGQKDPDFILRPSGEKRLSNFMLWQAAYSELVEMDVLWPDFTRADLDTAIEEFNHRSRRFGGI